MEIIANGINEVEKKKISTQEFIDEASNLLDQSDNFEEIYIKGSVTSIKITKNKPKEIKNT